MNLLADRFEARGLEIVAVPSNQFGHQNQCKDGELLALLQHVRPGGGFKPKFRFTTRVDVNGENEDPAFQFLKRALPFPGDDFKGKGSDFINGNTFSQPPLWAPLRRSDISWNFEKFLINQDGVPVRRYSPGFETANIADDIEALLDNGPNALGILTGQTNVSVSSK